MHISKITRMDLVQQITATVFFLDNNINILPKKTRDNNNTIVLKNIIILLFLPIHLAQIIWFSGCPHSVFIFRVSFLSHLDCIQKKASKQKG